MWGDRSGSVAVSSVGRVITSMCWRYGVLLYDALKLEVMLLVVIQWEDFIENHYGAVAVRGSKHQGLSIRGPVAR